MSVLSSLNPRVEHDKGTFRTTLRLQGNRWFGSCNSDNETISHACLFATMLERLNRGPDLPESPNEMDEVPIIDIIESYDPLELWPIPPGDIIEFWNYLAYAFYKKKLPFPEFMQGITDLPAVQKKMAEWEQEREIASWYDRIDQVNERPPTKTIIDMEFRLVSTINEGRLEFKEKGAESWTVIREKQDIDKLVELYRTSSIRTSVEMQMLWEHYLSYYTEDGNITLDLDKEEACSFMNRLFHQPALKDVLVNLDEQKFRVTDNTLSWECGDDKLNQDNFCLQLVTKEGEEVTHSVRLLPGRNILYQSDETVFPGPPRWLDETEVMPTYQIPKSVIDSLEGVEFLRKIGSTLPESMKKRVVDLELLPEFNMRLEKGLTSAETEHLVIEVTAIEKDDRRTEKLRRSGWEVETQKATKSKDLLRFSREKLYQIPDQLTEMGLTFDEKLDAFKVRISKQFPEKFAEWVDRLKQDITIHSDSKLGTILADPVTAAVRFEVISQEIDWFNLRIVIDLDGLTLDKAQIRQLVSARGGYVRMDDGSWMRLEIKLDDEQREAVTRLGLDPFDFSGETHRMHALQLADPKASDVFDPKIWEEILSSAKDINVDVKPDIPTELQATLRPYQQEGFHFLSYLSTNGFGGILADDMGLGKTIQSITYLLWLRQESIKNGKKLPALVVCPKSVLDVWQMECNKFAPELKVEIMLSKDEFDKERIEKDIDIIVLNYAQLRVCGEALKTINWLAVVLDEGQQIKNPDSKASSAPEHTSRSVLTSVRTRSHKSVLLRA